MVLMAAASDHRHHRAAKSSGQDAPASTSPSPTAAKSPARAGLLGFTFSWGAHRRLRCSKDGAPVYDSTSPSTSPPQQPHTPSPVKEKPSPQDPSPGCSSRPQRPRRNLRPLHYAHTASLRSDGAGHALKSPSAPPPPEARKRKRSFAFAVALTKEEIADDFAAIRRYGRPSSRARGKKLKKEQIDSLCPGSTLDKVDLDNYKIDER
ncbi:unnamed protein product [Alopecurus aequalis]